MGIYVFETKFIVDQLRRDADDPTSSHDFGKDIIPHVVKNGKAYAHRFTKSCVRSAAESGSYWRDVGTVDAYWEANIDLVHVTPDLNLYDAGAADLADRARTLGANHPGTIAARLNLSAPFAPLRARWRSRLPAGALFRCAELPASRRAFPATGGVAPPRGPGRQGRRARSADRPARPPTRNRPRPPDKRPAIAED
jgi:hypothetical protein